MMNTGSQVEGTLAAMLNDASIDAIIAFDVQYIIVAWNRTAEVIYGLLKAAVLGRQLTEVLPSLLKDPETGHAIKRAYEGIKSFVPASNAYPHRLQVENHFIPLADETRIVGVMNIVHDVAHRIKAEEQLQALNNRLEKQNRQLQQTAAELASFTLISSNNIKQPIRHMYTAVENLIRAEAKRLTDTGKASFRRIQSSLSKMDLLLDDLLGLAQVSILEKRDTLVDLNGLLTEVTAALQPKIQEKNVRIEVGELGTIYAHAKQLHTLFYHLLDNAIKFNESRQPWIRITCKKEWASLYPEVAFSEREYYRITILDDGIGFSKEEAEKIFTLFEKLHANKYKGSGVGLAIARKIMDAHDGFIRAEPGANGGANFHCFFPVNDQPAD